VDKIVGPGNKFVTAAKAFVSNKVAIDKPAGPSEILIIADDSADPRIIAMDLISQAEHGIGSICGLVAISGQIANLVESQLTSISKKIPKKDLVNNVLSEGGFIYETSITKAIDFVNSFAPEHLEIITKDPDWIASRVSSAGLILIGPYTPVASSDYCMGTNHVLPTYGYSKIESGLTVLDFLNHVTVLRASKKGLDKVRKVIETFSKAEGLTNHCLAVEERF
jgi:histidinol dehydrogenase